MSTHSVLEASSQSDGENPFADETDSQHVRWARRRSRRLWWDKNHRKVLVGGLIGLGLILLLIYSHGMYCDWQIDRIRNK